MDSIAEIQSNEVQAIRAIFFDDFEELKVQSAWKVIAKNEPPYFKLHLKPTDCEELLKKYVSVDLTVKFVRRYPNELPELRLNNIKGLSEAQTSELNSLIQQIAKSLIGQEMIYEIATFIQEWIAHNHSVILPHKGLTSSYAKMQRQKEHQEKLILEEKSRLNVEKQLKEMEEEHDLTRKIEEELQRKEKLRKEEMLKRKKESFMWKEHEGVDRQDGLFNQTFGELQLRHEAKESIEFYPGMKVPFDQPILVNPDDPDTVAFKSVILTSRLPPSNSSLTSYSCIPTDFVHPFSLSPTSSSVGLIDNVRPPKSPPVHSDLMFNLRIAKIPYAENADSTSQSDTQLPTFADHFVKELDKIKNSLMTRHQNVLTVFDYQMDIAKENNCKVLLIKVLEDSATGGSLTELLNKCNHLSLQLVRSYIRQLLSGLVHMHAYGNHKDIRPCNILFSAENVVKLGCVSYVGKLRDLVDNVQLGSMLRETRTRTSSSTASILSSASVTYEWMSQPRSEGWMAPELKLKTGSYSRKSDIWYIGVVMLEMLAGRDITSTYSSYETILSTLHEFSDSNTTRSMSDLASSIGRLPTEVKSFLLKLLNPDPKKRASGPDLLSDEFFQGGAVEFPLSLLQSGILSFPQQIPIQNRPLSAAPSESQFNFGLSPPSKSYIPSTSSNTKPPPQSFSLSRYKSDFEELEFLGKGGFGEVVKARNKLDGRLYAIKRVKLDLSNVEENRKILREVRTLSRLNSVRCVRYYQAWVEDAQGVWSNFGEGDDISSSASDSETSSYDSESSVSSLDTDEEELPLDPITNSFASDWLASERSSRSNSFIRFASDTRDNSNVDLSHRNEGTGTESESLNDTDETDGNEQVGMFGSSLDSNPSSENTPSWYHHRHQRRKSQKRIDREKDKLKKEKNFKLLYIQMEYCEKKTLRDAIDEGIDEEEVWNLFRQIVEGLAHIHAQGMIHRDLKPKNIFMDANSNIKIGDFGLATTNYAQLDINVSRSNYDEYGEDNLTSDIGTTLYVAPEVINKTGDQKYNQKVDMYSLGIIFFEMLFEFSTLMERALTLRELRKKEIIFPAAFNQSKFSTQTSILKWLLNHDPKQRPTSLQLLQSELLPPKMEDEYIQEALRAIVNNNTPYYGKLMTALFGQREDRHKDYTYDFNSGNLSMDQYQALYFSRIRETMTKIFRKHGAVEFTIPLLTPKSALLDKSLKKPVVLLDSSGGLVQLPYDLTISFARYISRNSISQIKRYTFGQVFRENVVGGQPRTVFEVDFDIVHPFTAEMIIEAEVLKVVSEILDEFPPIRTRFHFRVNHAYILEAIFQFTNIPIQHRAFISSMLDQLGKTHTWGQIKNQVSMRLKLKKGVLDALDAFNVSAGVNEMEKMLKTLIPSGHPAALIEKAMKSLRLLERYIRNLGVGQSIIVMPLLTYNMTYYQSGFVFQAILNDNRKKLDVLASGGRYDSLIKQFSHPTSRQANIHAVGVHIAIQKVMTMVNEYLSLNLKRASTEKGISDKGGWSGDKSGGAEEWRAWEPRKCDVLVASYGSGLLNERMILVKELWSKSVRAEFLYEDGSYTSDQITQLAKVQGINWVVFVKKHQDDQGTVKVKNVQKKTEQEIPRAELAMFLSNEINDYNRSVTTVGEQLLSTDSDLPYLPSAFSSQSLSLTQPDLNVTVLPHPQIRKMKHKQKQLIIEKALKNAGDFMKDLKDMEILALSLTKETLKLLAECNIFSDDSFKKVLDSPLIRASDKGYLQMIRKTLLKLAEEGQGCCLLYSQIHDANELVKLKM